MLVLGFWGGDFLGWNGWGWGVDLLFERVWRLG